jgi:membrane-associated phospholipid phosphatase
LILVLISVWGPPWLRPILFLWTPAMALSRVALGLHYLSDVVGGILLGVAIASLSLVFF